MVDGVESAAWAGRLAPKRRTDNKPNANPAGNLDGEYQLGPIKKSVSAFIESRHCRQASDRRKCELGWFAEVFGELLTGKNKKAGFYPGLFDTFYK